MKNDTSKRTVRRIGLGALVAAGASIALSPAPATALGAPYNDFDTLTVSAAGPYSDSQTVTVSGSGLTPGAYDLSVCEYASYNTFFPGPPVPVKIPACGVTIVPVTVSGAGTFSTSFTVTTSEANAHAGVGTSGQPAAVDFDSKVGEFVLVPGHGAGFGSGHAADSVEFNVTP